MDIGLRGRLAITTTLCLLLGLVGLAPSAGAASRAQLQQYEATVDPELYSEIVRAGYDVVAPEPTAGGIAVDLVLSPSERQALESKGVDLTLMRDAQGRTAQRRATAQARGGFTVWRDYDGADGLHQWMYDFAEAHDDVAELEVIGESVQGREIIAIRLTRERGAGNISRRPATLYQGTAHSREWISTEVTRRLMVWLADQDKLLKKNQLWFIPVVNPDGYQYTFDTDRLWRKNLRDNDGNGVITNLDGVDLNRNLPDHWRYDDEGSSSIFASETYRGDAPASEPETQANMGLFDEVDFKMAISYHSYGALLLYPEGWQIQTPSRDDPIYIALTGTDAEPAVEGFDPDVSAELYTTNGEFTDWAHGSRDALAWTPELEEGCDGCGFVFPDDPELVEREFEINKAFARDVALSADNPEKPESHLGNETEPFYLETVSADPERANNPLSDLRFSKSYGDPQPVEVLARRSLGNVTLNYRINGGPTQTASTSEWEGGETFGDRYDTYYRLMRGEVTGTDPGDSVEVWFSARGKRSESFTYEAVSESGAQALVVASEDYSGISNSPAYASTTEANYDEFFTEALTANGITHDVYDVDAEGRVAPDALGVLSHYDAAVWYTGNDVITRDTGMVPGTASRLANDLMLEMRAYMNEGGKLLYNGQYAGLQYAANAYLYDPVANAPCAAGDPVVDERCLTLSDDFQQYNLGAYLYSEDIGTNPDTGNPYPVEGTEPPFEGASWEFNGTDSAQNQEHTASLLTTSSILPTANYPQFASDAPAAWQTDIEAPFEPFDGSQYLYSDRADVSYKRLTRPLDLTGAASPSLTFRTSYDAEAGWDFLMVEIHTQDQDDWTTLPATLPDGTTVTSDDTGSSCPEGWIEELHPFLNHYQTHNADETCSPTGNVGSPPGEWNAATGRSGGWEEWNVDLSDYAGQQVEVSISYVSDWGFQGIGVFLDQVETSTGEGNTSFEDDGNQMDGWVVADAPEGSDSNPNSWRPTESLGFEEGAVTSTDDSLYFGFGFEGISGAEVREDVMGRSMGYLLGGP
jgi:hypothetical protein